VKSIYSKKGRNVRYLFKCEKPHVCSECMKRFSSTSNLKTHMRLHSGQKPYGCDKCNSRFTQYVHLKLHRRLHNNERPFVCGTCNKSYISASGLRTHWKTTSCTPTPEEEAFTAEKSIFLLQQSDPLLRQLKMEEEDCSRTSSNEEDHIPSHSPRHNHNNGGGFDPAPQLVMDIEANGRSEAASPINTAGGGHPEANIEWRGEEEDHHQHHRDGSESPHSGHHHQGSESPPHGHHHQVHIIPADHLELADNMFNNGPTINVVTTSSSDEGEREHDEGRSHGHGRGHSHGHTGPRDRHDNSNITCI